MGLLSRALEKRSSLANPDEFLIRAFGGAESKSGVSVTPESALTNTAVLAAIERLSRAVATLPLMIYRRLPNGGRERDTSHRLWPLLHDAPNEEHTALEFRQFQMASLLLRGNSFSFVERNGAGDAKALWPLRSDQISTERVKGSVVYTWTPSTGKGRPFAGNKIHHLRGLSRNGLIGLSPISLARESVGLGLAAEEFGSRFFSGGANAGSVLTHPGLLSDPAAKRLKDSFDASHTGLSNSHKTILLEEGTGWEKTSVDPRDAQFIELRKFQTRDAARIFGVQPHLIADLDNATFTNIESQGIEFVVYTLAYWLKMFEQSIQRDLFSEADRKTHFVEFLVEGLLRGDVAARGEFYNKLFQMGALSPNEIRARENLNPVPGGDTRYVPLNMAPVGEDGIPMVRAGVNGALTPQIRRLPPRENRAADGAARRALREGFAGLFAEAMRRVLRSERELVMKEARRQIAQRNEQTFSTWLEGFYSDHEKFVEQRVAPVYRALAESVEPLAVLEAGVESTRGEAFDEFTKDLSTAHAARHTRSSLGQLRKAMVDNPEDPVAALDERFDLWEETRADRVGKRSAVQGGEAVARFVFAAAGVAMLWRASGKSCPLCEELDGRRVGGSTPFLLDGETLNVDGTAPLRTSSPILHAPLHDGCDCWISAG